MRITTKLLMEIIDSRLHGDNNNKIEDFQQSQVKIIKFILDLYYQISIVI